MFASLTKTIFAGPAGPVSPPCSGGAPLRGPPPHPAYPPLQARAMIPPRVALLIVRPVPGACKTGWPSGKYARWPLRRPPPCYGWRAELRPANRPLRGRKWPRFARRTIIIDDETNIFCRTRTPLILLRRGVTVLNNRGLPCLSSTKD